MSRRRMRIIQVAEHLGVKTPGVNRHPRALMAGVARTLYLCTGPYLCSANALTAQRNNVQVST